MDNTREAVRNARGLLIILIVAVVLGFAFHRDQDADSHQTRVEEEVR